MIFALLLSYALATAPSTPPTPTASPTLADTEAWLRSKLGWSFSSCRTSVVINDCDGRYTFRPALCKSRSTTCHDRDIDDYSHSHVKPQNCTVSLSLSGRDITSVAAIVESNSSTVVIHTGADAVERAETASYDASEKEGYHVSCQDPADCNASARQTDIQFSVGDVDGMPERVKTALWHWAELCGAKAEPF